MAKRETGDRLTIALRFGRKVRLDIDWRVSPEGVRAAGAFVSSVLLSTAALVAASKRGGGRVLLPPPGPR